MDISSEILHWNLGVITSAEPDEPELQHALIRGDNMMFSKIAAGRMKPRKRLGMALVNAVPLSPNPAEDTGAPLVGGTEYNFQDIIDKIHYIVTVNQNGDVHVLLDDGQHDQIEPEQTYLGTLNNNLTTADFAVMNNRLFILDGRGGRASLKGDQLVSWGVPKVTGLALAADGAGVMTGNYEVVVTGYDDQIGEESAVSDVVNIASLNSNALKVTVNAVPASETHRYFRIYIRKPSVTSGFFRVIAGPGYNSTVGGFPLASANPTVEVTIDVSDTTLVEDMIMLAPKVGTNLEPPATARYVAVYKRRLFVADRDGIYWSELDRPDSFSATAFEPIRSRDPRGGEVTGLTVSEDGQLYIFTENARIILMGDVDVRGWQWDVDTSNGSVNNRVLVTNRAVTGWWHRERGPTIIDHKTNTLVYIGDEFIRDSISSEVLNIAALSNATGTVGENRILWAVPDLSKLRNTRIFVFNLQLMQWESTRWDPMDASVLFTARDTTGKEHIYLGNYNGQLFRMLKNGIDGVRENTGYRATFTATNASQSVLECEDLNAAWDTLGAGIKERKVTVLDSKGRPVTGSDRPYIVAVNGDDLTLSSSVSGLVVGQKYTVLVGGPDFVFETYRDYMGDPFAEKRFDDLFIEFRADDGTAQLFLNIAFNYDDDGSADALDESIGGQWDDAMWDVDIFDSPTVIKYRLGIFQTGFSYRIQVRNPFPNQGFTVLKLRMLAKLLSYNYRRAS